MPRDNPNRHRDNSFILLLKGFLIGISNIIPGVSGGTFALILGIFDRMIAALHNLGADTVRACVGLFTHGFGRSAREEFAEEWKRADLTFMMHLVVGAAVAIVVLSPLMKWLLQVHPGETLAFFLGLIIPSLAVPWKMMTGRNWRDLIWVGPGICVTVGIALALSSNNYGSTAVTPVTLAVALASGTLAVSAMVLPGISGSFVLLVIGQYGVVLHHLVAARSLAPEAFLWLATFGLGTCIGIISFARLLHWVMERWRSATLAFLIGLVLGSFWILWPFKEFEGTGQAKTDRTEVKREIEIATAPQRLPRSWSDFGLKALALAAGLGGALSMQIPGSNDGSAAAEKDSEATPETTTPTH